MPKNRYDLTVKELLKLMYENKVDRVSINFDGKELFCSCQRRCESKAIAHGYGPRNFDDEDDVVGLELTTMLQELHAQFLEDEAVEKFTKSN